jgi:cytidylate kinase
MAIITISRLMGSHCYEIAKSVADKINYAFIDKPDITESLAEYGPQVDEKFNEKGLSFWESFSQRKKSLIYFLKAVLSDFAKKGNVLIYGWGAQVLFKDIPGVLRVRINAPFDVRLNRLVAHKGYDEKSAEKTLRKSDRDSAGYISAFFQADWKDEDLYDLILNTEKFSVNTCIEFIVNTLSAHELNVSSEETAKKINDLSLTQKVKGAIMEVPGLTWTSLYVDQGVANISGTVHSEITIEECKRIASGIKGITNVNTQLIVRRDLGD